MRLKWFVEPNLRIELLSKNVTTKIIKITFDLESRPQSAKDDEDYFIDFEFSNEELKGIAKDLKSEYQRFPLRP